MRLTVLTCAAAAALVTIGCSDRDHSLPEADSRQAAAAGLQVDTLTQQQIDSLKQLYAVLRRDSAPEPQPSSGPGGRQIPAAMRAFPRVLRIVTGEATFYADQFEGQRTASGIPFRQNQMVAAHRAFPFGTLLRVTNTRNGKSVNVRVVDRGPWGARAAARNTIIDLSRRAAAALNYTAAGRAPVKVEVLEWGTGLADAS